MSEALARFEIGKKIATLRAASGSSTAMLASEAAVSEEALRAYESGARLPTLEELARLANALAVDIEQFFRSPPPPGGVDLVRATERWSVPPPTTAAQALDFRYQALTHQRSGHSMSPFLIEIPPQRDIDLEHSAHPGEEFIFVLSGELAARIGDAEYRLGRGDSVYFDSRVDHVLRAEGAQPVRLLACFVGVTRDFAGNPLERAFQLREGSGPKKRKPQDGGPSS